MAQLYSSQEYVVVIASMLSAMIGAVVILGIAGIVLYVLRAIGMMTIAKNRGMRYAWLAWIPIAGDYQLGAVADDIRAKWGNKSYFRFVMLGLSIFNFVSSFLSMRIVADMMDSIANWDPVYDDATELYGSTATASSGLSALSSLTGLAAMVLTVVCLYYLFKAYAPQQATMYTVLCAIPFTSIMQWIFPFVIRKRAPWQPPVMPPGGQPPYGYGPQPPQYGPQPPQAGAQPPQYGPQPPQYGQQPPQAGAQPPQYGQQPP